MKQKFVIMALLLTFISIVKGQNLEFRLISGIGISPLNLDSKSEWSEAENHLKLIPLNLDMNYLINTEKKITFIIGSGLAYTQNQYFQNVKSIEYGYNLRAIKFSQHHLGIPLRLGTEWNFYNGNSIGLQYELQYNLTLKDEFTVGLEDFDFALNSSLEYNYSLTSRTKNFLSNGLSIYLKTQISKNNFVVTSLGYEFRPTSGTYDFKTDQIQTLTNNDTGDQSQIQASHVNKNEAIKNNFLFFRVGFTHKF